MGLGAVTAVANQLPVTTSLAVTSMATAALLTMFALYWTALRSTDWVLRSSVRVAGRLWPSRFGGLARSQQVLPFRGSAGIARFRVKEHFTLDAGASPMLVVSGDILDGVVRGGMRACAVVDAREVSARIHSVEYVDQIATRAQNVGLLLSLSEQELRMWKSAAIDGTVLRIV
jgi:hypothetical protein